MYGMGHPAWVLDLESLGGPPLVLRATTSGYLSTHRSGEPTRVRYYGPRAIRDMVRHHGERWLSEVIGESLEQLRR